MDRIAATVERREPGSSADQSIHSLTAAASLPHRTLTTLELDSTRLETWLARLAGGRTARAAKGREQETALVSLTLD